MKTEFHTTQELVDGVAELPFDLSMIPNQMGINLVSVEGLSWTKQADGQFVSITIHFIPEEVTGILAAGNPRLVRTAAKK